MQSLDTYALINHSCIAHLWVSIVLYKKYSAEDNFDPPTQNTLGRYSYRASTVTRVVLHKFLKLFHGRVREWILYAADVWMKKRILERGKLCPPMIFFLAKLKYIAIYTAKLYT